jgi:hypothetical protein
MRFTPRDYLCSFFLFQGGCTTGWNPFHFHVQHGRPVVKFGNAILKYFDDDDESSGGLWKIPPVMDEIQAYLLLMPVQPRGELPYLFDLNADVIDTLRTMWIDEDQCAIPRHTPRRIMEEADVGVIEPYLFERIRSKVFGNFQKAQPTGLWWQPLGL